MQNGHTNAKTTANPRQRNAIHSTGGWQGKLKTLIDAHNHLKVSGRGQTSYRTREKRAKQMFQFFQTLRNELNFKIEDPDNLKVKHIEALMKHWAENKLTPGTIDNNLSVLRVLCTWMGKDGMVKPLGEYNPELRHIYAAQKDKSWAGNGVDFWQVWQTVLDKDRYVAMQMLLIASFGARRKEAVSFKPLLHTHEGYINLVDGTKGGRPRNVPIDSEFKKSVINVLLNFITSSRMAKADGSLGSPNRTLEENMKRYSNTLAACGVTKKTLGVTGHGLRAEYAIDQLEKLGIEATIRGGSGKAESKLATDTGYLRVSEELGHSRISVMTAYGGTLRASLSPLRQDGNTTSGAASLVPTGATQQDIDGSETTTRTTIAMPDWKSSAHERVHAIFGTDKGSFPVCPVVINPSAPTAPIAPEPTPTPKTAHGAGRQTFEAWDDDDADAWAATNLNPGSAAGEGANP